MTENVEKVENPISDDITEATAEVSAEAIPEEIPSMNDFKDEINASFKKYEPGDIVTGTVIGVSDTEVIIDLGSYAEGIIKIDELSNDPHFSIKADVIPGESYTAIVLREDREGNLLLSRKQADDILAWKTLKQLMNSREVRTVRVAAAVNSGVTAYLEGVRAFIPASQLAVTYVEDTAAYVGRELQVIVITVDEEKEKLVLSAKEVEREQNELQKARRINSLLPGTVTTGIVEKLMPFGAFVKLPDGLSGLVHISEISEKRLKHPREVLKENDEVKVKIIAVKDGKLSLSIKAVNEHADTVEDSLDEAPSEYTTGESTSTGLGALLAGIKLSD